MFENRAEPKVYPSPQPPSPKHRRGGDIDRISRPMFNDALLGAK